MRDAPISIGLILRRFFGTPIVFVSGIWISAGISALNENRLLGELLGFGSAYYIGLFLRLFLQPALLLLLGFVLVLWPEKRRSTAFGNILIFIFTGFAVAAWHFWLMPTVRAENQRRFEERQKRNSAR